MVYESLPSRWKDSLQTQFALLQNQMNEERLNKVIKILSLSKKYKEILLMLLDEKFGLSEYLTRAELKYANNSNGKIIDQLLHSKLLKIKNKNSLRIESIFNGTLNEIYIELKDNPVINLFFRNRFNYSLKEMSNKILFMRIVDSQSDRLKVNFDGKEFEINFIQVDGISVPVKVAIYYEDLTNIMKNILKIMETDKFDENLDIYLNYFNSLEGSLGDNFKSVIEYYRK